MYYAVHAELNATLSQKKKKEEKKTETNHTEVECTPHQSKATNFLNVRSPPSVALSLPSTSTSHSSCFICRRPGPKLIVVLPTEWNSVFLRKRVLIPYNSRCCAKHLLDDEFTFDSLFILILPTWSEVQLLKFFSTLER